MMVKNILLVMFCFFIISLLFGDNLGVSHDVPKKLIGHYIDMDNEPYANYKKYKVTSILDKDFLYFRGFKAPWGGYSYSLSNSPDIKYNDFYKPTINNLRMRDRNDFNKIIRILSMKDKIAIIGISRESYTKDNGEHCPEGIEEQVVDGIKGYWVRIQTEDGEFGICFSGYLEKIESIP